MEANKVLIVAAETSSALYARRLLEHWKKQGLSIQAYGIGDGEMQRLGFNAIGRAEDMAVVGFSEVIKHYLSIRKVFYALLEEVKRNPPRVALLLDYPGFNLRLAKELKKLGVTVVYYISPQLWAWKKGRIKDVKKFVDRMFVVFPFEVEFYSSQGMDVEFVGHPILDELQEVWDLPEDRRFRRSRYGLSDNETVLGLMPGSRISEIDHILPTQLQTAWQLAKTRRNLRVLLLAAPSIDKQDLSIRLKDSSLNVTIVKDNPFEMVNLCDVVLCASGTATVLVGLAKKPMVIMYKMSALSAAMARFLVTGTKYFGMVNLIFDKLVCAEFFQESANPNQLSQALAELIDDQGKRLSMGEQLAELRVRLGNKGATVRVAEKLSRYFEVE